MLPERRAFLQLYNCHQVLRSCAATAPAGGVEFEFWKVSRAAPETRDNSGQDDLGNPSQTRRRHGHADAGTVGERKHGPVRERESATHNANAANAKAGRVEAVGCCCPLLSTHWWRGKGHQWFNYRSVFSQGREGAGSMEERTDDIGRTMTPGPGMPVRKPFLGSSSQAAMVFRVAWL